MRIIVKILLEIINFLFNKNWFFLLIGKLRIVESIFLAYPANEKYALAYGSRKRVEKEKWSPWITGILIQKGRIGIMFSVSACEKDFLKQVNSENLKLLSEKIEEIRKMTKAKNKSFAGILQGLLYKKNLLSERETGMTASFIVNAIRQVETKEKLSAFSPVIIIGGDGFVGKQIRTALKTEKRNIFSVEIGDKIPNVPKAIIINVASRKSLRQHIDKILPGMVVVNEVYPEPTKKVLEQLKAKSISCYHIMGAKAFCFPKFPGAYKGAIPCCAAWQNGKAVVRRLY
jgi:hypothetical protein